MNTLKKDTAHPFDIVRKHTNPSNMAKLQLAFGLFAATVVLLVAAQRPPSESDATTDDASFMYNDSTTSKDTASLNHRHNFTDFVRARDVLNVFSVDHIASLWPQLESRLNDNCSKDLMEYLQGLEAGAMWAMQSKLDLHF